MCSPALDHRREENLRKHSAQLAHRGAEPVARRAHARGEDFRRRDEGGRVGSEVEEELCQNIQNQQVSVCEVSPGEAEDAEEERQDGEAADLDRLAAELVDCEDGEPVAGEGAGAN